MQMQAAILTEARTPIIIESAEFDPLEQIYVGYVSMLMGDVALAVIVF